MKIFLLIGHILSACIQCLVIPFLPYSLRSKLIQTWSKTLLKIFEIRLVVHGNHQLLSDQQSALIVSNHISWIDIHVINTISPVIFVAKSDVANWPIFGWIAKRIGTIFIVREKVSDIKRVLSLMGQLLGSHKKVCIFPEGTSTDGRSVLKFKSNLFQVAVNTNTRVIPICITYKEQGRYSDITAFIGEMGLIDSIKKMLKSSDMDVHVHILEPLSDIDSRQELANLSHQLIEAKIKDEVMFSEM
jgi:1-acyl-sn-glycerol-3-phosphate acyltransferase